jgi:flagellar FliJ protein
MSKTFPLQTLLELSQRKLDDAAIKLGQVMLSEQEMQKRVELLQGYRAEYRGRFMAAAQDGLSRDQWQNYQAFLDKLDAAVSQAEKALNQSRLNTENTKQQWVNRNSEVKAYDTLAHRHQEKEQHIEQRKDQKQQDEHSARKSGSKNEDGFSAD